MCSEAKSDFITEMIVSHNSRSIKFNNAIKQRICGRVRNTSKKIMEAIKVSRNAIVLGRRFLLAIKDKKTSKSSETAF